MFLELFSRDNFFLHYSSKKLLPLKSMHEHKLHKTVSQSKMQAIPLRLEAIFGHFKQSANKPSPSKKKFHQY